MENNNQRVLTIVIVATVLILVIIFSGVTYAFFTANNPEGSTAEIKSETGRMLITYNDGTDNIVPVTNIQPSDKILIDKTFTLTGTNTTSGLAMPYKVGLKYTSGFSYGQLHYYLKRTSANSNITSNLIGTTNQTIPGNTSETGYTSGTFIKNNTESYLELATGEFKANTSNQTITFNLKIQFPDTGENQDSEKGATFNGEIVINYEDKLNNIAIGYDYLEPTEVNTEPYYTFTAPKTGTYKIETWGAQGTINGGLGAYSHGHVILQKDQKMYVYIGGQNGYNGGTYSKRNGGGGYYGGGAGGAASGWCAGGGGGSSYIGNTLLTNKAMYCYNCTESSETSTKTISTTCHSENPTSNCAKEGNGYAKITLISN